MSHQILVVDEDLIYENNKCCKVIRISFGFCLIIGIVGLCLYFIGAFTKPPDICHGGDRISGTCPKLKLKLLEKVYKTSFEAETNQMSSGAEQHVSPGWFLEYPKTFMSGSCNASELTGNCCHYYNGTCLTTIGCLNRYRYEYYNTSINSTSKCIELMSLLSCSIAFPTSGYFVNIEQSGLYEHPIINICYSLCHELWQECLQNNSTPLEFCEGLYQVTVEKGNATCFLGYA